MSIETLAPRGRVTTVDLRSGVRVEVITVLWMAAEAAVALVAGVMAGSLLLTAFGLDSVIELISGAVLLRRLQAEANDASLGAVELAERLAAWVTGISLGLLCLYVLAGSIAGLVLAIHPEHSLPGIALSVAAVIAMPVLAWRKRTIAERIQSQALRADAACSMTCAWMAATLLVGLAASALFGWWWADSLAALAFLVWLVPETREAL